MDSHNQEVLSRGTHAEDARSVGAGCHPPDLPVGGNHGGVRLDPGADSDCIALMGTLGELRNALAGKLQEVIQELRR